MIIVEQVAKMLHISRDKVYYLLRTRQLRSIKIGKIPPNHRQAPSRVRRFAGRRRGISGMFNSGGTRGR